MSDVILEVKNTVKDRVAFAADLEKEDLGLSFALTNDPEPTEKPGAVVETTIATFLPQIDPGMPEAPGAE